MSYPYRCRQCGRRKSLAKPYEKYIRKPVCECGGALRFDAWRFKYRSANTCNNGACLYPFPHRRGSKWCVHYQGDWDESEAREMFNQLVRG